MNWEHTAYLWSQSADLREIIKSGHPYHAFLAYRKALFEYKESREFRHPELLNRALDSDAEESAFLRELSSTPSPDLLRNWDFLLDVEVITRSLIFSRDDRPLALTENSAVRDWAFYVPILKASSISGLFRNSLLTYPDRSTGEMCRIVEKLMGATDENEPCPEEVEQARDAPAALDDSPQGVAGRNASGWLHFYPMIFDKTEMDLITPLDPKRRFPKVGPIGMEGVKSEEKARLGIGYFPLDPDVKAPAALDHLEWVCRGLHRLVVELGIGAKRNSDFGSVELGGTRVISLGSSYEPYLKSDAITNCWRLLKVKFRLIKPQFENAPTKG